ncbi:hypothetical protein UNH65_09185 [Chitinophaga sp. 180180018-2]|nr:hypothetical protein [Chitinophaga sp. 212800010-3]
MLQFWGALKIEKKVANHGLISIFKLFFFGRLSNNVEF